MKEVLSAIEVAKRLRVGRKTVVEMIQGGQLKGFKRGRLIRVTAESVRRLLDGAEKTPEETPGAERAAAKTSTAS